MASSRNRGKQRLIIVGIDGATCTVIEPLVKAGKLPNLGKLIESGSMVKLLSTIHPMSPQAWTSFHTGVSPWKHGVFGFLSLDIGQPVSLLRWRDIQVISMVEMLDRAGICTIWNNLVGAYPFPKLRNGIVAGGRMTPSKADLIYPEKLQDDLQRLFPSGYARISLEALVEDGEISETGLLSRLLVHTEHQTRLTTHLMKSHPWDLCFVMFDATDIGQHTFWRYFDVKHPSYSPNAPDVLKRAITTIFRRIDDSIGELIQVAPENTNVMILSDHGFVPLCATVNLNGFLARAGYTVPVRSIDRYSPSTLVRGISSRLGRSLPNGNDQELEPIYQSRKIKWKKTSVYTHGYMGNLFVNLKGREPEGCIFPKDYEKVLQRVIEDLYRWKNPVTGDPLVRTAHRSPASIMHQHHLRGVPDLILEWFDYRYAGIHPGAAIGVILRTLFLASLIIFCGVLITVWRAF